MLKTYYNIQHSFFYLVFTMNQIIQTYYFKYSKHEQHLTLTHTTDVSRTNEISALLKIFMSHICQQLLSIFCTIELFITKNVNTE